MIVPNRSKPSQKSSSIICSVVKTSEAMVKRLSFLYTPRNPVATDAITSSIPIRNILLIKIE